MGLRESLRSGGGKRGQRQHRRALRLESLEGRVLLTTPGTWQALAATNPGAGPTYGQALALLSDGTVMIQGGQNAPSNAWYDLTPAATGNTFPGTTTNTGNYVNGTWTSLAAAGTWSTPAEMRLFNVSAVLPSGKVFTIGGEYTSPDPFTGTDEIFTPSTSGGPGSWTQVPTIPTPPTSASFNSNSITGASNTSPITISANTTGNPSGSGLVNGQQVTISGVGGNTAANGTWTIAGVTATSFNLVGSTGNGTYTNGGSFGVSQFGDDPIEVLPGGKILAGYFNGPQTYIFDPATNTWSATASKLRGDSSDEETWIKLPDGSILSYDIDGSINAGAFQAQRYIPAQAITGASNTSPIVITSSNTANLQNGQQVQISGINGNTAANGVWTIAGVTATGYQLVGSTGNGAYTSGGSWAAWMDTSNPDPSNPPPILSDGPPPPSPALPNPNDLEGAELGPGFVMPNGNAIFFGGNGLTAIYNPTTNLWSAGPNMPTQPHSSTISGASNVGGGITGASNTSPITITTGSTTGLTNGDLVTLSGVTGNTAANGNWTVTNVTGTTFQLINLNGGNSTGNAAYTGGGTWFAGVTITTASTTGLNNGQLVTIAGVGGNTAANGSWTIFNLKSNSFQLVGPQGNGAYTSGGTWSTSQLSMDNAPGAMMGNGDILLNLSPLGGVGPNNGYTFPNPSFMYEFNPTDNSFTNVTPAGGISDDSDFLFMIALPSGQVLVDNELVTPGIQIYTPVGLPQPAWQPVITNIASNGGGNYTMTGTLLNGISEGGSFGDEATMATNYPVIQLTDSAGNVTYARTTNWSTNKIFAVGDTTPETVNFTLPAGKTLSDFKSVIVTSNGIPSAAASPVVLGNTDENVTIQVNPLDSTQVQVLVTNTNTVVATYPNNSPNPITVVGDANNNIVTVNEGNGVVNTPISFDGGGSPGAPGDQMILLGTSGNDLLKLTPASSTSATMSFDGSPTYSFTDINQFAFDGEAGNDTMTVDSSTSLLDLSGGIHFDGGTGDNNLELLQTGGPTQTSDTYTVITNPGQGSDVIVGAGGTQSVFFQNLAPVYDNVPSPLTVVGTPSNNTINYEQGPNSGNPAAPYNGDSTGLVTVDNFEALEFSHKTTLTLQGLNGDDTFTINNISTPTGLSAINVRGQLGNNTLVVDANSMAVLSSMITSTTGEYPGRHADCQSATTTRSSK